MVSIGFDAVAGLSGLSFTIKSVLAGRVHQITRAATRRTDLHMLHDALGGVFIALDEAPVGSLLPKGARAPRGCATRRRFVGTSGHEDRGILLGYQG